MYATVRTANFPIVTLLSRGVLQAGIPGNRNRNYPAISEVNRKQFFSDANIFHSFVCAKCQNTQAMPLKDIADFPEPTCEACLAPWPGNRDFEQRGIFQPELSRRVISINVYVRWLIRLMAIEIEAIRSNC